MEGVKNVIIREYRPSDCKYLAELFYQTVHSINAKDYTDEQLNVWATGNVNINEWNQSLSEHFTLVAIKGGIIAGFGDIDRTGCMSTRTIKAKGLPPLSAINWNTLLG